MQLFLTLFAFFFVTVQVFAGTLPVTPEVINGTYGLAGTCGGNCPSNTCTDCYCGTSASYVDIASWCSQHSWNQANCQCIMKHESGGNANAMGKNTDGSYDVGLWQINSYNWNSCSGGGAPCNPSTNLYCAKMVYQWGGNTWKFWSTCGTCGACSSN